MRRWTHAGKDRTAPGLLPHQFHLSPTPLTLETPQSFSLCQASRSPRTCLGAGLGARTSASCPELEPLQFCHHLSLVTSKDTHLHPVLESGLDSAKYNQHPVTGVLGTGEPGFISRGSRQTLHNCCYPQNV